MYRMWTMTYKISNGDNYLKSEAAANTAALATAATGFSDAGKMSDTAIRTLCNGQ